MPYFPEGGPFANCGELFPCIAQSSVPSTNCQSRACDCEWPQGRLNKKSLVVNLPTEHSVKSVFLYKDSPVRDKYVSLSEVGIQNVKESCLLQNVTANDSLQPVQVPIQADSHSIFNTELNKDKMTRIKPLFFGNLQAVDIELFPATCMEKPVVVSEEEMSYRVDAGEKQVSGTYYKSNENPQSVNVTELECAPPLIVPSIENVSIKRLPNESCAYDPSGILQPCRIASNKPQCGVDRYSTSQNIQPIFLPPQWKIPQKDSKLQKQICISQQDFSEHFSQSHTKDYIFNLGMQGMMTESSAVTPTPSTQVVPARLSSRVYNTTEELRHAEDKKEKAKIKKWWLYSFFEKASSECCKEKSQETVNETLDMEIDPVTGYPKSMPSDFADYFKKVPEEDSRKLIDKLRGSSSGENSVISTKIEDNGSPVGGDLEPTIEYKGAISKTPEYGGSLQPISFKLHAIEVHQFIPLPDTETPLFVKMVSSPMTSSAIEKEQIEKLFGPVTSGWADPGITGMPAPMMNDILQGTMQPNCPLLYQKN